MLNAIFFYRLSRWLYLHHIPLVPKLITLIIFLLYNSKVPYKAEIGKGTKLGYGGIGVVIHSKTVIGRNCMIGQNVTLGGEILTIQGFLLYVIMCILIMVLVYLVV